MIQLTEISRSGAQYKDTQPLLIDPALIETARPGEVPGYDGRACRLQITNEERPVFVAGTVEDLLRQVEGVEGGAAERLIAIKEMLAQCLEIA